MGDWYEEWYGRFIVLGIALLIGGLIFLFVVYPAFFSGVAVLWWVCVVALVGAAALVIIGIIGAIAD